MHPRCCRPVAWKWSFQEEEEEEEEEENKSADGSTFLVLHG
jgi:hypothetical protein